MITFGKMARRLLFIILMLAIAYGGFAQLPFSTVREIYNFDVGDTLEMSCSWMNANCALQIEDNMNVILAKDTSNYIYKYKIEHNGYSPSNPYCPFSSSHGWSYTDTEAYNNLDSSVFWYHTYHAFGYDSNTFYVDTAYVDTSFYDRKVNEHFEGGVGWYRNDTAFADGLGEISYGNGNEDFGITQGGCSLAFYHKASGEMWGRRLYIDVTAGIDYPSKDEYSIDIGPNPAVETLYLINRGPQIKSIAMYTITGKLLQTQEGPLNSSIDISGLSPGIYLARFETEQGIAIRRWVKM